MIIKARNGCHRFAYTVSPKSDYSKTANIHNNSVNLQNSGPLSKFQADPNPIENFGLSSENVLTSIWS